MRKRFLFVCFVCFVCVVVSGYHWRGKFDYPLRSDGHSARIASSGLIADARLAGSQHATIAAAPIAAAAPA